MAFQGEELNGGSPGTQDRQPPGGGAEEHLDSAVLTNLRKMISTGQANLFQTLVSTFREETGTLLTTLQAALAEGSPAKVRAAAHSLKGAAFILGARQVADLSAELEKRGRAGSVEGAAALLDALEVETRQVFDALQAECQRRT
jgi:HPt (histidine-containing phosphotransfer) domain-containing protein